MAVSVVRGREAKALLGLAVYKSGLRANAESHCHMSTQPPHLVQPQFCVLPHSLVIPFSSPFTMCGRLVGLALTHTIARVRIRELRIPFLRTGRQCQTLAHQQLDCVVETHIIIKECVAVLHLWGNPKQIVFSEGLAQGG